MIKYTANYTYTNPNFVIQNLVINPISVDSVQLFFVLKNILQRGFPTAMSNYLQLELAKQINFKSLETKELENEKSYFENENNFRLHKTKSFDERFLFAENRTPRWHKTIKGDIENNYFPAKDFFETIIPNEFGEYSFVQSLIIPEIEINEITGEENERFIYQQVDFYLPQAKLVIEIDGQQHKIDEVTRISDDARDSYLSSKGIKTVRITTNELQNGSHNIKVEAIVEHLSRHNKLLSFYKEAIQKIEENRITEIDKITKLLPTAIIRFQLLVIELLINNYLSLKEEWRFNILCEEELGSFAELAIEDLQIWFKKLWKLKNKTEIDFPQVRFLITQKKDDFKPSSKAINVDFSLFQKYTDENELNPDIIYVRTDYFDIIKDKNYFRVSTSEPINYKITDDDKNVLEFFLQNIFDKTNFREGQFPIVSNALNLKDTIGLLPTGGGKSLCYQLPCLLQPTINFVVCPIKALMYDQNENLANMLVTNVNYITSDLEDDERRRIELEFERGRYLFVWVSPEKFQIPSFRNKITAILAKFSIAYAIIDEVHCLSEWGHDFRTSYLNLAKTIDKLSPKDENNEGKIKFLGLTATASLNVLKDIKIEFSRRKQKLADENIKSLLDYSRKELQFEIINDKGNKRNELERLIKQTVDTDGLTESEEKCGLIFTPNVNGEYGCYSISNFLNTKYPKKVNWFAGDIPKVDQYDENGNKTGKKIPIMKDKEFKDHKKNVQEKFKMNQYPLLVATKAFGMGIDKQNIFYTLHYGLPSSVEALYQEAGRAGRWDKSKAENKTKTGKCYVLYSPETYESTRVDRLFHKETTFSEMKEIAEEVKWEGKDIFKQVFLFTKEQNDTNEDSIIVLGILKFYFKPESTIRIFWNDAFAKLKIDKSVLQKAIYRLSLLGIVSDWTTNFKDHFEVHFNTLNERDIIISVTNYISKYEPTTNVEIEINKIEQPTLLERSILYLLNWIFENISYNRKQSLKTLKDWCTEFIEKENFSSDDFKRRIDSYFVFSETTFILQDIGENPNKFENWFQVFYLFIETLEFDESNFKKKNKIYIPEIINLDERKIEFEKLRDSISRFLESYRNNIGLDFLSGFVRLALNEYQDSDGKERFESAIEKIKQIFDKNNQNDILNRLLELGNCLNEDQKADLCQSILKVYPEKLEFLAEYYDLAYLLNDMYIQKISQLKALNHILYEQLTEI